MQNPLLAIILGLFFISFVLFIFWPVKGVLPRLRKRRLSNKRVQIENALKHLHDYEYRGVKSTLDSIAGNLSISGDNTAKLLTLLEKMGLVFIDEESVKLTPQGRTYSLRIIRIHRLWEKYLADETGVPASQWHSEAEEIEHILSKAEADQLAAKIGNPLIDPHGDPIPTAGGEMPRRRGRSLTSLYAGEVAEIVHIEDEPQTVYTQILALGLYPGMQIRVSETSKDRIKFEADGDECVLAPSFAANITVRVLKIREEIQESFKSLNNLSVGETGTVKNIAKVLRGQQRRRLMDLGVVPGTKIKVQMNSAGGDPRAYQIRGATIALRKKHANSIYIEDEIERKK